MEEPKNKQEGTGFLSQLGSLWRRLTGAENEQDILNEASFTARAPTTVSELFILQDQSCLSRSERRFAEPQGFKLRILAGLESRFQGRLNQYGDSIAQALARFEIAIVDDEVTCRIENQLALRQLCPLYDENRKAHEFETVVDTLAFVRTCTPQRPALLILDGNFPESQQSAFGSTPGYKLVIREIIKQDLNAYVIVRSDGSASTGREIETQAPCVIGYMGKRDLGHEDDFGLQTGLLARQNMVSKLLEVANNIPHA